MISKKQGTQEELGRTPPVSAALRGRKSAKLPLGEVANLPTDMGPQLQTTKNYSVSRHLLNDWPIHPSNPLTMIPCGVDVKFLTASTTK